MSVIDTGAFPRLFSLKGSMSNVTGCMKSPHISLHRAKNKFLALAQIWAQSSSSSRLILLLHVWFQITLSELTLLISCFHSYSKAANIKSGICSLISIYNLLNDELSDSIWQAWSKRFLMAHKFKFSMIHYGYVHCQVILSFRSYVWLYHNICQRYP